jgi:hypothetical protein
MARVFCAAQRTLDTAPDFHMIFKESGGKKTPKCSGIVSSPTDSVTEPKWQGRPKSETQRSDGGPKMTRRRWLCVRLDLLGYK